MKLTPLWECPTGPETVSGPPIEMSRQAGQAVPHDAVAGLDFVLVFAIAAKEGHELEGITKALLFRQVVLVGTVAQEVEVVIGEDQEGFAVGYLASERGHEHDTSCKMAELMVTAHRNRPRRGTAGT